MRYTPLSPGVQTHSNLFSQNSPAAGVVHPLAMFSQFLWLGGALLLRGVSAGISSMDI